MMFAWFQNFLFLDTLHWQWQIVIQLSVAALLGAIIGVEREYRGRSAGLRTHLLVSLGAALVMVVSLHFARIFGVGDQNTSLIRIDPARMAYGIMSGIGFLGAGAIIQSRMTIRGLTTAATLWCTAAVGLSCGMGMLFTSGFVTLLVLFALLGLGKVDNMVPARQTRSVTMILPMGDNKARLSELENKLKLPGLKIHNVDYRCDFTENKEKIKFYLTIPADMRIDAFREIANSIPDILSLKIR